MAQLWWGAGRRSKPVGEALHFLEVPRDRRGEKAFWMRLLAAPFTSIMVGSTFMFYLLDAPIRFSWKKSVSLFFFKSFKPNMGSLFPCSSDRENLSMVWKGRSQACSRWFMSALKFRKYWTTCFQPRDLLSRWFLHIHTVWFTEELAHDDTIVKLWHFRSYHKSGTTAT